MLGLRIAGECLDVVLADAEGALGAVESGTPNEAFERMLEATICCQAWLLRTVAFQWHIL